VGVGTSGKGRRRGDGEGIWIWCKYCVHMHANVKMISVEAIPRMGGRKGKWEW
jgi:hypothetical protein